ncbi:hypothetical protein E3N88_18615 [Mikania micrantha]|uniref:Uncharacterized protein n=1 Tax=Mikania micrantha TaxID=192012 RepID=A0A5N6NMC2_9ASTR|nr:hypothetical protein E3N88_18615 [Mikania micrantha]
MMNDDMVLVYHVMMNDGCSSTCYWVSMVAPVFVLGKYGCSSTCYWVSMVAPVFVLGKYGCSRTRYGVSMMLLPYSLRGKYDVAPVLVTGCIGHVRSCYANAAPFVHVVHANGYPNEGRDTPFGHGDVPFGLADIPIRRVRSRSRAETDPAVEALATLITEQLVTILPGIITRIRNSEEFARSFPLLAAEKKEPEGGETSRKRKRGCSKESRELVIYIDAIPLRQMAVAPESEGLNTTNHEKQRYSNNIQKHIGCDLMSTNDRNQMTDKSVQEQCENRMFS